jgi:hypothetical protein
MDPYDICSACSCFIKAAEAHCPFCGAEHRHAPRAPVPIRRMSRAQWLALGSALVLTSCGGSVKPGPLGSGQQGEEGDAQQADSGQSAGDDSDAAVVTGDDASRVGPLDASSQPDVGDEDVADKDVTGDEDAPAGCGVSHTTFQCAGTSCNAATQYCYISYGGTQVACQDDSNGGYFPSQCLDCPTCDCVAQYISGPSCKCVDLGGGAIGVQCAGCYGAPPTRLELLAA